MNDASARHVPPNGAGVLLAVCLFAATLILFWPATGFDFIHLDDTLYVPGNPMVAGGLHWAGIRQAFTTVYEQWWLPLLWLSYMADITLFGPGPFGHHLVNILLHAANAALLFWVLFRMTGSRWRSAFAAALFAWHPLRVESVAWITERKDVLSGLFFLLALLAYVRQVRTGGPVRMWPVTVQMLLGLMAKSILVVLPGLLLLLDFWPLGRAGAETGRDGWRRWRQLAAEKIPLFFLSAVFIYLTLVTHGTSGGERVTASWLNRLALVAPNILIYLEKTFWPAGLTILNPTDAPVSSFIGWLAPAGLIAVTFLAWRFRRTQPYLLTGWLWFLVALLPVVRGIRFDEQSAFSDRYTYLPGIGLGLVLAWGAGALQERWRWLRWPLAATGILVLAACLVRTPAQLAWWRNSLTLFPRAVALAPNSAAAQISLGNALFDAGQLQEAEAHLGVATKLQPWNDLYRANWGLVLAQLGRAQEARAVLAVAWPDTAAMPVLVHGAYGMAGLQLGEYAEAIRHLELALEPGSGKPGYRVELIRALFESGAAAQAREQVQLLEGWPGGAIRTTADLFPYYQQRWREGARAYVWEYFRRLAEQEPDNAALLNNIAWLVATDPDAPEDMRLGARDFARRAVELTAGGQAATLDTLAAAQAACGDSAAAAETARRALDRAEQGGDEKLAGHIRERVAKYENGRSSVP